MKYHRRVKVNTHRLGLVLPLTEVNHSPECRTPISLITVYKHFKISGTNHFTYPQWTSQSPPMCSAPLAPSAGPSRSVTPPWPLTPLPNLICMSLTPTQLIPQIIINNRRHNTIGLQRSMMLLWACAGVPLGAYNITNNFNIALLVQPQILTVLSLITWIQCFHYDSVSPFYFARDVADGIGLMSGPGL
jgi:hypothetical protein